MLKLAIIGVGWAGTRQAEAARELGDQVTVTALVDPDLDHLHAKAAELEIDRTYSDLAPALADPEIEAVSICAPHQLHCPLALKAAAAGKHILVEKPLAVTVAEATQMIEAAKAHRVKLYVAENLLYTPMSKTLRRLVRGGQHLGQVTFAGFVAGFQAPHYGYPGRRAWLSDPAGGGSGTWLLHGIHSMAQLRYIFGRVETVYLRQHQAVSFQRRDLEGTMSGLLTLSGGLNISVVQTCETKLPGNLGGYIIYGDQGIIRASRHGYEVVSFDGQIEQYDYPTEPLSDYAQELAAFAAYVAGEAVGPTTAESERRTLAVVQAGYESAARGQPINLAARFGPL